MTEGGAVAQRRRYSDDERAACLAALAGGRCVVYGLRAKGETSYFYVGSTKFTPAERLKQHLTPSIFRLNRNRHFVRKVNRISPANVVVDVLEEVDEASRFAREYDWIRRLAAEGAKLTNIVTDAATYAATAEREEYQERVSSLVFLRSGWQAMKNGPGVAVDPQRQRILELLHAAAMKMFDHLRTNFPAESAAIFDPALTT